MANRIALAGKPLAGKTTLARLLRDKYGYRHASISEFIVDRYIRNRAVDEQDYAIFLEAIASNKESYRPALQHTGDTLGFQDPEKVVGVMQQVLKVCGAWDHLEDPVVLEPIRGEVQASAARALGFIVVELWVDSETQFIRSTTEDGYWKTRQAMADRPDIESGVESASVRLTPKLSLENQAHLLHLLPDREVSHGPATQPFTPYSFADWGRIF